ncbi:MAG: tRNA 2-selenouridine(34) synthase MnmH [Parachlamydiales bacterium]|jgi:tRNA 2-selenouridine synthase
MNPDLLIKNFHDYTIVDVRSPFEYSKGHIPTSINIPLFSDEERKIIGTTYKQQGKKEAIEKGLGFVNLPKLIEQFKPIVGKPLVIYCARGGMRSYSVAWLLRLFDYDIQILKGGYKSFRGWAILQFKKEYNLKVIGGFTGIGKTEIIKQLNNSIDLEDLANHKGSVFGGFEKKQPTQEHFENLLAFSLFSLDKDWIFVEDESRFIGTIYIPNDFYDQMKKCSVIVLQDILDSRITKCVLQYKKHKKEDLKNAIKKIEKKLGILAAKTACCFIDDENYSEACRILFSYYDKGYSFSLSKRDPKSISYLEITNKTNEQICASLQNSN